MEGGKGVAPPRGPSEVCFVYSTRCEVAAMEMGLDWERGGHGLRRLS